MLVFNEQSSILARRLDEYAEQPDKTHDLYPYISACTLDIIAGLTISIYFLLQNKNYFFQKQLQVHIQTLNQVMEKMSLFKQLFGKIMELHLRNFFSS